MRRTVLMLALLLIAAVEIPQSEIDADNARWKAFGVNAASGGNRKRRPKFCVNGSARSGSATHPVRT